MFFLKINIAIVKYLIKEQPKNFESHEYPINFDYLYLYYKSKFRYFFLSKI